MIISDHDYFHQDFQQQQPFGEWVTSKSKMVYPHKGQNYPGGFHIFLCEKDAEEYAESQTENTVVAEAHYDGVLAEGRIWLTGRTVNVVVARQMLVSHPGLPPSVCAEKLYFKYGSCPPKMIALEETCWRCRGKGCSGCNHGVILTEDGEALQDFIMKWGKHE